MTEIAIAVADSEHPARAVGTVLGRLVIVGLMIWGIVHQIRKRRRPRPPVVHPQPYWDGTAWQYPHPSGPQTQPYWNGVAWQYPPQQSPYTPHNQQAPYPTPQPQHQGFPQQQQHPPHPNAPH